MPIGIRAPRGEKTIELRVRFFTNDIANRQGNILPKHAWDSGSVYTVVNESHGIATQGATFNSLPQVITAIEKVLMREGIQIHPSHGARSLYVL